MRTVLGLLTAALLSTTLGAQSIKSVAAQSTAVSSPSGLSIDRKITVHFEAMPLHDALQAIARQSGAQISYREATLPAKHRVTLNVTDVTARNVLKAYMFWIGILVFL